MRLMNRAIRPTTWQLQERGRAYPPNYLHDSHMRFALRSGADAICEKPLVPSLQQADQLAAKAKETGRMISPVFQYRYGLGTRQLQALMAAGLAGRCYVGTLETHWDRDAAYYAIPWRGTWAGESGGALLGHAIHIHDLLPALEKRGIAALPHRIAMQRTERGSVA